MVPSSFFGLCSLYFSTLVKILPFVSFLTHRCTAPPASVKSLAPTLMLVKVLSKLCLLSFPPFPSHPTPSPSLPFLVLICVYLESRRESLFSLSCVGIFLWLCVDASLALHECFFGFAWTLLLLCRCLLPWEGFTLTKTRITLSRTDPPID